MNACCGIHLLERTNYKTSKFGTRAYLKGLKRMTKTLKWMTKTLICSADLNWFDQEFLFNPRNFDCAFPVII